MNKNSKKIIIFHQEFYYSGGAEHTLFEEIDFLQQQGFEVVCYAPLVSWTTCYPDRIKKYPIKSLLPYLSFIPREVTILIACTLAPLLLRATQYKADLYIGANQAGPYLAYIAQKIWKKPFMVYMPYPIGLLYPREIDKHKTSKELSLLGKLLLKTIKPLIKKIDTKLMQKADSVITEGTYAQKLFQKIYQREIINDPPGTTYLQRDQYYKINRWENSLNINNCEIPKPYILITSRHMPKKKLEYAVQIAKKINNPIIITGKHTHYTKELIKTAKDNNLSNIHFIGYTNEDDTLLLYKNAALYIYTAPEEDFGKGIIQAMGYGIPAIAWNNAGPTGIIKNNVTGYLIEPNDTEDLIRKTQELLKDKQKNKEFGSNAIQEVKSMFSHKKHNHTLLQQINKYL